MDLFIAVTFLVVVLTFYFKSKHQNSDSPSTDNKPTDAASDFRITVSYGGSTNRVERKPNDYKWIPPNEPIEIAGYKIPGGMIYCGKHLKSVSSDYEIEPGFIKTGLKVSSSNPDREGKNMNYWPSYSNIPPTSRAAYLAWLAGGRTDPDIDISYVFLFFYGLERRLLYDAEKFQVSTAEIHKLLDEINVLLNIYGPISGSFNHYANSLKEYMHVRLAKSKFYDLEPYTVKYTYDISSLVKLALGQLAKEGKPLTAKWMHEYAIHHPEIIFKTPARRCTEEFRKLFYIRYKKKFGDGIVVKPNKTRVKIGYHCASSGMRLLNLGKNLDIPDVSILKTLLNETRPLVDECQDELDKYSRWLGQKGNQKNSFVAYSLLPEDLTDSIESQEVEDFRKWLNSQLDGSENVLLSNNELIKRWPVKTPGKMTRKELLAFISFLQKLGFGIEPDIRFGGMPFKIPGDSVLFRLNELEDVLESPSQHYTGKFILLHFAAAVAKADGVIADGERTMLIDSIENTSQLIPAEKRRMRSALNWLLQSDSITQGLNKKIEMLDQPRKEQLADYMAAVAGADGFISPEEVKTLTRLFKLLGFEEKQVYSVIHRYQTDQKKPSDELISVRPADSTRTGFAIPKPPAPSEEQGFVLDKERIASKMKDTEQVSALLEGVFEKYVPEEVDTVEENEDSIHGLDGNHSAILLAFQKQSLWPRADFEKLTARHGLMPDGALEVLNEKAFELFEDALCEAEDPIEINQEILKEFLK